MDVKLYKGGKLPQYTTTGDACMDCYAAHNTEWLLEKGSFTATIRLGFGCQVPRGYGLFLFSRSGMGFKSHIQLVNGVGVIDGSYGLNEIQCKLIAPTNIIPQPIRKGDRVCQMCLVQTPEIFWNVVEDGKSGKNGFGSTGL